MSRAGAIFLAAYYTHAKRVYVLGSKVIYVCNFDILPLNVAEWDRNNYRSQRAISQLVQAFYDKPVVFHSKIQRSMTLKRIMGLDDVFLQDGVTYIVFTQSEKDALSVYCA